jgi:hypothetical protein
VCVCVFEFVCLCVGGLVRACILDGDILGGTKNLVELLRGEV